ncbi:Transcriptional repressor TUP1 domain protein [Candida parapsilosis]|uniref:Transcriptional repressor TUP1 domain protein n=1 Tax=Candida parapsilosis TaxID=5480 RepID=A0A8X7TBL1_CANPA|nr:Transcriptional repressor TUP1 domain protein [Candida parapsilosis]KAF6049143.1 Transcriptional repressor TUP1 domain protein [Candida parapsilosis]KAF6056994.1 Transcriptional repressor TUP1 domain protein [Candida parapsilosis]KAF6066287.1 Transcriptional repressor TUP1 domain protein [Candida parapsilosis]KAI5902804.1 Transcriptional repressor TUP1 [Candida parapsilosis]
MSVYNQRTHQTRLNELLDAIKTEFDYALNEATSFKKIEDEYHLKYSQQNTELQQIRQTVYELEMAHRKIKEAYEEEILRLKTELENRDRQMKNGYQQQQQQQQQQQAPPPQQVPPPQPQPVQQPPQPQPVQQQQQQPLQQQPPAPVPPQQQPPPVQQVPPPVSSQQAIPTQASPAAPAATAPASTSNALTIIDKSQYIVNPAQKAAHVKEIPPFLQDLDVAKANPDFKKQNLDYYVLYNPAFARDLDVDLIHSLDHSSVVCCVRFSKDGKFIATGCNKTTQVFNVETGELVAKLIDDSSNSETKEEDTPSSNGDLYIRSVCFSPDGKLLATGAEDRLIRIWDLTTKRIIKVLRGHEQDIYSLDFFPDGDRLVSGSGDRSVRIWSLRSGQCSLTLSIEDGVTTVAVSPDGKLIAAGSLDRTVRVWDSTTGFLVERLDSGNDNGNGHEDSVYSVAFSNTGNQIASGSLDRTVKLWNLDGKSDKNSSCEATYIGHKDFVLSVCCTPNNEYILSGSKDRGVIFWDQASANPLLMLQGHRNSVISVAVSSNLSATEGIFATGSGDCKARIWKWTRKV